MSSASEPGTLIECLNDTRSPLAVNSLLDALTALSHEVSASGVKYLKPVQEFFRRYTEPLDQLQKLRMTKDDFEFLQVIGRGAFGEVQLVRYRPTGEVYAMKMLSKCEMLKKMDTAFFWEERDIMAHAASPWIVKLHYAFQDEQYLYMVMEYMAGGNLVTLQDNVVEFPEDWARFYTAELILALDSLHKLNYVHRDVKPDNILLDASGHLKLADFGTCVKTDENGQIRNAEAAVGTPEYISPEVLNSQGGNATYGRECDWWSVGIFLYELLCGDTPFYDESLLGLYSKITQHKPENLEFPDDVTVSEEAKDLIRKLLSPRETRLGAGEAGVEELKTHPFFKGVDWQNIRRQRPPCAMKIENATDTTNFPDVEEPERKVELFQKERSFTGNQLPFIGFSFSKDIMVDLQAHNNDLGKSGSAASMEKSDLVRQVKILTAERERYQGLYEKASTELAAAQAEAKQAISDKNAIEEKWLTQQSKAESANKGRIRELEKELALANVELKDLRSQLESGKGGRKVMLELETAKSTIEDLQGDLRKLEKKNQRLAEDKEDLTADNESLRKRLLKMETELAEADRRARDREDLGSNNMAEFQALSDKLAEASQTIKELEVAKEDAEVAQQTATRRTKRSEERVIQLEDELDKVRAAEQQARAKYNSARSREQDLEAQIQELEATIASRDKDIRSRKTTIAQMQVDLDSLKADIERLERRNAALDAEKSSATRESDAEQLQAKDDEIADLQRKIRQALQAKADMEQELFDAEDKVTEFKALVAKYESENKELHKLAEGSGQKELEELKVKHEELEQAHQEVQESLVKAKSDLEHSVDELDAAQQRLQRLTSSVEQLQQQLDSEATAKAEALSQVESLQTQLTASQEKETATSEEVSTLQARVKSLEAEHAQLKEALEDLEARKVSLESKLGDSKTHQLELATQLEEKTTEASHLQVEMERLRVDLEHRHKELEAELDAANGNLTAVTKAREDLLTQIKSAQEETADIIESSNQDKENLQSEIVEKDATIEAKLLEIDELQKKVTELSDQNHVLSERHSQMEKLMHYVQDKTVSAGSTPRTARATSVIGRKRDQDNEIRNLKKQNRQLRDKESKAQKLLAEQQEKEAKRIEQIMDSHEMEMTEMQTRHKDIEDGLKRHIRELERQLEENNAELDELRRLLDRVGDLQTDHDDASSSLGSPREARKAAAAPGVPWKSNIFEGWLDVPEKGGLRKGGWKARFAVLDSSSLRLYEDESSKAKDAPVLELDIRSLHTVSPVRDTDVIYAKQGDVPRIFKLIAAAVVKKGPTESKAASEASHLPPPSPLIRSSSAVKVQYIKGHEFERHAFKKPEFCELCHKPIKTLLGATHGYQCKHCKMTVHAKHIENNDSPSGMHKCPGEVEVNTFVFRASTEAEQRKWVSRLSQQIQRRGELVTRTQRSSSATLSTQGSVDNISLGSRDDRSTRSSMNRERNSSRRANKTLLNVQQSKV